MKLIDFNDVFVEAARRHDSATRLGGKPAEPFVPDAKCLALVSALLDEVNLRLVALSGWDK